MKRERIKGNDTEREKERERHKRWGERERDIRGA